MNMKSSFEIYILYRWEEMEESRELRVYMRSILDS